MNSDTLGSILSLSPASGNTNGLDSLSGTQLVQFFQSLLHIIGIERTRTVLYNGLLNARKSITLEQWESIINDFHQIRQSESNSRCDGHQSKEYRPLSSDECPTDIVANIYKYLDHRSHSMVEHSCRRLCIIGRKSQSCSHLGSLFEGGYYKYFSVRLNGLAEARWLAQNNKSAELDPHKFANVRNAVIVGSSARHSLDRYARLYSKVKRAIICGDLMGNDTNQWRFAIHWIREIKSLTFHYLPFSHLCNALTIDYLRKFELECFELNRPFSDFFGNDSHFHCFFKLLLPSLNDTLFHHFSHLRTLKLVNVGTSFFPTPISDILTSLDASNIVGSYPKVTRFVHYNAWKPQHSHFVEFVARIVVALSVNLRSLHCYDTFSLNSDVSDGSFSNLRELCCQITQLNLVAKDNSYISNLEKLCVTIKHDYNTYAIWIEEILTRFLESRSKRLYLRLNYKIDSYPTTLFDTLMECLDVSTANPQLSELIIAIHIETKCAEEIENVHFRKQLTALIQKLIFRFKRFQLTVVVDGEGASHFSNVFDAIQPYYSLRYRTQRLKWTEGNQKCALEMKSKHWYFVESSHGRWECECPNCEYVPLFNFKCSTITL